MKKTAIIAFILLSACYAYADGEDQTVTGLVDKAVDVFKTQGKEHALKLLNASAGPLRKGSIYAFAVDFKGRNLSHPVQEDLRGRDTWEQQDAKGKFVVQEFVKIAKEQGQGWSEYWWIRVNEATPTLKKTFVKKVPGEDILVGAGYYVK
jgi:cytochrome c